MLTFTLEPGLAGLGYSCNTAILKHFQGFFFSLWECQMKLLELEGIINQLPYYSHHDRWAFRFFFFLPFLFATSSCCQMVFSHGQHDSVSHLLHVLQRPSIIMHFTSTGPCNAQDNTSRQEPLHSYFYIFTENIAQRYILICPVVENLEVKLGTKPRWSRLGTHVLSSSTIHCLMATSTVCLFVFFRIQTEVITLEYRPKNTDILFLLIPQIISKSMLSRRK